ncbi:MAG: DUF1576 domain-containing protein [Clostridia bacterium]|nr:DUF1576 domain-containing protein [Clostridia bacterium]
MTTYDESKISEERKRQNSLAFSLFALFLSCAFLLAVPVALKITDGGDMFWQNLLYIFTGPSKLVTDYFDLGCLASTLFNAGICGLACNLLMLLTRAKANSTTFAGYLLVIAHCFYGLNFVNMWPTFAGVVIYCLIKRQRIGDNLHTAMFATALAPFISDLMFYYPIGAKWEIGGSGIRIVGLVLAVIFGFVAGFLVPALIARSTPFHRGHNMYKAGLALGLLGVFVYNFLYPTFGITPADPVIHNNPHYHPNGNTYLLFLDLFFTAIFTVAILLGFFLNGRSFRNYKKLLSCSGYGLDFAEKFGMPLCFINFGIYGFCILAYLNIIFWLPALFPFLPQGAGFTGPAVGIVFAALTFSADGQHPRNVAPVVLGYVALFVTVCAVCLASGFDVPWTLSTQTYINSIAFATGLCPIAGRYGFKYGLLAGVVSAIICSSTASMHGGFVLYNGGFNAGLAAMLMIMMLDFYKVKPKNEGDDDEIVFVEKKKKRST